VSAARLHPADVEAIAQRVAELLHTVHEAPTSRNDHQLVTAHELARMFGFTRGWVYANADPLGAARLGDGNRPRLRFDPDIVRERLASCSPNRRSPAAEASAPAAHPRRRAPCASGSTTDLLPIRGAR